MGTLCLEDEEKKYREAVISLSSRREGLNFPCTDENHYAFVLERMFSMAKSEVFLVIADWTDLEITKLPLVVEKGIKPILLIREHVIGPEPDFIREYEDRKKIIVRRDTSKERFADVFERPEDTNDGILTIVLVDHDAFTASVRIKDLPQKVIRRMVNFHYDDAKEWAKKLGSLI